MGLKAGDVCRVRSKNGALVRADRELTSAKVKELPANTVVTCVSDAVAIDSGAERESGAENKDTRERYIPRRRVAAAPRVPAWLFRGLGEDDRS